MARKSSTLAPGFTWPPLASRQLMCTVSPEEIVSRGSSGNEWAQRLTNVRPWGLLYRHDHLQLNQGIARQGAHAYGGAHVTALVFEYGHEQIGRSVDDCRGIGKA